MKLKPLLASSILAASSACAGLSVTEENDLLFRSDDHYSQGLELRWWGDASAVPGGQKVWSAALRNLIYTPSDITDPDPQPDDRPWAGMTALSYGEMEASSGILTSWEALLGVVGDWSQSEFIQTEFHRLIGNKLPMGWDNQIPHEPVINVQGLRSWNLLVSEIGGMRWLSTEAGGLADAGTAFDDVAAFGQAMAGFNPPECRGLGGISPKAAPSADDWSAYLFGGSSAKAVFHNVMLGGSFWQDGPSQSLEPVVCDLWWGACVSKGVFGLDLSATFTGTYRTKEFKGQEDPQKWGMLRLGFGKTF